MQEDTDEGMQETVISAEHMHEKAIHDDGNKSSGEAMVIGELLFFVFTEDHSSSTTCCVYVKETSGVHTCIKCSQNGHAICGHYPKVM